MTEIQRAPDGSKAYVLRTCGANMGSHGGFVWPETGPVEAPDWKPIAECGNGLHGLLDGEGDGSLLNWDDDAKWLVVAIEEWIELGGKVKFPRGEVLYAGERAEATRRIYDLCGMKSVVAGKATAGDRGTATAGDAGTISIKWWDGQRRRCEVGYIGENGLRAATAYRLDESHRFVPALDAQDKEAGR